MILRVVVAVVGVLVVVSVFLGMVDTLISTRLHRERHRRFSTWLPSRAWPAFRALGRSVRGEGRREAVLSSYPSVLLLALIGSWVAFQVLGWGLVWWGTDVIPGVTDLDEALYYSGVVYFTVGFGDLVPVTPLGELLTLVEAFSGVVFIALTVGYLPSLYSAFSERERLLLRLDDGGERRITPGSLMRAELNGSTDLSDLDDVLDTWDAWAATVLESHGSHPMLAYFRSQHRGQSWVTAMGLVGDVALAVVVLRGRHGPAWFLYRRVVRTLADVASSLRLTPIHGETMPREQFRRSIDDWRRLGVDAPQDDDVHWHEFTTLRAAYAGNLEALIDHLDAPRGFWGHQVGHPGDGTAALADAPDDGPPADPMGPP